MGKNSGKIFPEILHPLYTANRASDNYVRVIGPGNYQQLLRFSKYLVKLSLC